MVDKKERLGDWEADTVIGKAHKGVLVTLADRVSKKTLIAAVPSKHAEGVTAAIIRSLLPEKAYLETITFDNGIKFSVYCTDDWGAYSRLLPWEKHHISKWYTQKAGYSNANLRLI